MRCNSKQYKEKKIKCHLEWKILFFSVLFLLAIYSTMCIFQPKETINKYKSFFLDDANYDVMFFGSSHAENFFNPMVLWKEYGITSYNFGNSEEPLSVTYWTIRNAIHMKKPKVIVVDLFMYNNELSDRNIYNEKVHYALDSFPISIEKIKAVYNLSKNKEEFIDKFFTLCSYHSRWKNIANDSKNEIDYFVNGFLSYGHPATMKVESFVQNEVTDEKAGELFQDDFESLDKIISLCDNESIDLIFTSTPYVCSLSEQKDINLLTEYLSNCGVRIINYNCKDSIIDYETDLYNIGHVNAVGAKKVTEFIGKVLVEGYLNSKKNDEKIDIQWKKKYEEYIKLKYESVWAADDLDSTLMLINDDDFEAYFFCKSNDIIQSACTKKLINNIHNNIVMHDFEIDSDYFETIVGKLNYNKDADAYIVLFDDNKLMLFKSFKLIDGRVTGETEYVNFESEFLFNK